VVTLAGVGYREGFDEFKPLDVGEGTGEPTDVPTGAAEIGTVEFGTPLLLVVLELDMITGERLLRGDADGDACRPRPS